MAAIGTHGVVHLDGGVVAVAEVGADVAALCAGGAVDHDEDVADELTEPGVWSPWFAASSLREGAFGWWEEVHGKPLDSLPKPEHPFEFRWRLVLNEVPGRIP